MFYLFNFLLFLQKRIMCLTFKIKNSNVTKTQNIKNSCPFFINFINIGKYKTRIINLITIVNKCIINLKNVVYYKIIKY